VLAVLPLLPVAGNIVALIFAGALSALTALATLRPAALARLGRILWRQKPGILVIILFAVVALCCWSKLTTIHDAPPETPVVSAGHWPTFRGGLSRAGHADNHPGPTRGGVNWSGGREFRFFSSAAIAGDALIAVGSRGDSGRIFCWNAASGRPLWTLSPHYYRATFASPVIANGYLVCGEGLHIASRARLIAYKFGGDGLLQSAFEYATSGHIEGTPVIDGDRVYFTAGDDGAYCLSLVGDADKRLVWHADGRRCPDAETALAVHRERVYVGLGRNVQALCVLDAQSGAEIARLAMPFPVFSPPAINGGRLYIGIGDANYIDPVDRSTGEVRCLDLSSLETIWRVETPTPVLTAVVAVENQVIFSTVGGQLLVVDEHGQVLHRWQAAARVLTAPAVTGEAIYCVSCDGMLTALNRALQPFWSVSLGSPGLFVSSPVVCGGHVFVGTPDDGFVSIGTASEEDLVLAESPSTTIADD
jgi:outer membrane protein assembly factor BamB